MRGYDYARMWGQGVGHGRDGFAGQRYFFSYGFVE